MHGPRPYFGPPILSSTCGWTPRQDQTVSPFVDSQHRSRAKAPLTSLMARSGGRTCADGAQKELEQHGEDHGMPPRQACAPRLCPPVAGGPPVLCFHDHAYNPSPKAKMSGCARWQAKDQSSRTTLHAMMRMWGQQLAQAVPPYARLQALKPRPGSDVLLVCAPPTAAPKPHRAKLAVIVCSFGFRALTQALQDAQDPAQLCWASPLHPPQEEAVPPQHGLPRRLRHSQVVAAHLPGLP